MSKIIFLNGTSSAGKSSIVKEILHQSQEFWLLFSIDQLVINQIDKKFVSINTEPYKQGQEQWFYREQSQIKGQINTIARDGEKAKQLHRDWIDSISTLADRNYNIVIDEVLMAKDALDYYIAKLGKAHKLYFVSVQCDPDIGELRERTRGDRWLGLSRGLRAAYEIIPRYDIYVDTTNTSPFEAAHRILKFIDDNPAPEALKLWNEVNNGQ